MLLKSLFIGLIPLLFLTSCFENKHELVYQRMPNIKSQNMRGETVYFKPHGFDKPALVNVWATWCKPCVVEMPSLEKVAQKGDYRVIAISNDTNKQRVQDFIREGAYKNIQFYYDAFGRQSRQVLKASGLPMTFLVDRDAYVQHVFVGEKNWQSEEVQKILNKHKVKFDD